MISKYFKMLLVAASTTILFSNCSKDDEPEPTTSTADFSPLTTNSTWTYKNVGGSGSSFTLTATNKDTVALGKTYRLLKSSEGDTIYLGKSGSNYYRFGSFNDFGLQAVEELYLKDNEAVNGTWTTTQNVTAPGFGTIPVTLKYTIKEKSISRLVGSKTFTNVTHVRLDLSLTVLGSNTNVGGGDFYYANGIGLVENILAIKIATQPDFNQTQILTDYTIK